MQQNAAAKARARYRTGLPATWADIEREIDVNIAKQKISLLLADALTMTRPDQVGVPCVPLCPDGLSFENGEVCFPDCAYDDDDDNPHPRWSWSSRSSSAFPPAEDLSKKAIRQRISRTHQKIRDTITNSRLKPSPYERSSTWDYHTETVRQRRGKFVPPLPPPPPPGTKGSGVERSRSYACLFSTNGQLNPEPVGASSVVGNKTPRLLRKAHARRGFC